MIEQRGASAERIDAVPPWHPIALLALLLAASISGLLLAATHHELARAGGSRLRDTYVPLLVVNWGLLLYVCRLGRPRSAFLELTGLEGYTPQRAIGDVALALLAAALLLGGETLWQFLAQTARNVAADALLPSTPLERGVWCAVAVSVGISEEVVYRGYLSRELARWTASRAAGIVGQALLFALAHGEQGAGAMLRFFVYALGLGVLALARRSLVPGMLAHVGVDLLAGLAR